MKKILVAATLFVASGACAKGMRPFDPRNDADKVADCFAVYLTLGEVAEGLNLASERVYYEKRSALSSKRLEPLVRASVDVVGHDFYRRAALKHLSERERLEAGVISEDERTALAKELAGEAAECDRLDQEWENQRAAPSENPNHVGIR